ncbi:hypothetical protein [Sinomonas sp. P10A9]|uniref:HEAT repeat domain-containing protein n=1 Tax=Sinomonas puerhi TaxID=3238584 RepID=A0AB39L6R5_9MICC
MPDSEWEALRRDLERAGVSGADELGRFVSNVEFFGDSAFDERAAMPVLLTALPRLTEPRLVSAVAGHLRRPWARPQAFDPLLAAFRHWAQKDATTAWHLGDALGSAATMDRLPSLVDLCLNRAYGTARQMPVAALGRFKKSSDVRPALLELIHDGDVGLHAMSALRRVVGAADALPYIEEVKHTDAGSRLGDQAAREIRKIRKWLKQ